MHILARMGRYFLYVLALGILLTQILRYDYILLQHSKSTFHMIPYWLYHTAYPILFGMLCALPNLWQKRQKPGAWAYDWGKVLGVGIPALFASTLRFLYFLPLGGYIPGMFIFLLEQEVILISGIVFGYTVLSGWEKDREEKSLRINPYY